MTGKIEILNTKEGKKHDKSKSSHVQKSYYMFINNNYVIY